MSRTVRRVVLALGGIAFCLLAFRLAFTRSFEFGVAQYVRDFLHGLPAPFVTAVLSHLPVNEDPAAWIVRKAASVVFFGVVGVLARALVGGRIGEAANRAWLVIGAALAMSAAIEIFEWPEPIGDVAFDLVCGVAGGIIAVLALRLFRRL
jgi:hypothetical protein